MISKSDLYTHLYPELIAEITRNDDTLIERSISAALAEAKSYLSRYDILTLFGGTLPDTITGHLKNIIKDLAVWQLIRLANPNIDLKLFRTNYEDAIAWLKLVQSGKADPFGWPVPVDNPNTPEDEAAGAAPISWSANVKRTQHF